MEVMDCILVDL